MDKRAKGKARAKSLENILNDLLTQNNDVLSKTLQSGLLKNDGSFHLSQLAKMVGFNCEAVSFRQNKSLGQQVKDAHAKLKERGLITSNKTNEIGQTKMEIGNKNEAMFLLWLKDVGTSELPAPINHNGRLYRKAVWAMFSEQPLLDVNRPPNWFNTRPFVKAELEALDVKLVRGEVEAIKMDRESIADDMENSMTSALVRKLRSEIKTLKEKLTAEREARKDAELKVKQNELLATQIHTGKMASIQ